MLSYLTRINIGGSITREVADNSPALQQGMALVSVIENGVGKVTQSTATPGIFAGIAYNQYKNTSRATEVEEFVAVGTTYKLAHAPEGGDTIVYDLTAGSSGKGTLDSDSQTLTTLTSGHSYKAVYAYIPSAIDVMSSRTSLGQGIPGFQATDIVNAISVIVSGDVYTDYFDVTQDWSTVTPKAGENGLIASTGSTINNAYVVGLPSVNAPVLGIYFNV